MPLPPCAPTSPIARAFDENGEFQSDRLRRQNRSLTNVVTFGLMGDE